ncbi:hypothetical protein PX52LOC_08159 [Limnoglobus roseus]|uniref:Uncharacterized protein n=2 Tax=Limnoglobus roseus TaxID=2598579 RepID=A0A5C1APW6_9BACT|nr:hypothetical protein PX52LOC_08159 [Limnoglobus roseus]
MAVMIDELKQQLKVLAHENAELRYERDLAKAQAVALLPLATPEQEAELLRIRETGVPDGLAKLIAELEAEHG